MMYSDGCKEAASGEAAFCVPYSRARQHINNDHGASRTQIGLEPDSDSLISPKCLFSELTRTEIPLSRRFGLLLCGIQSNSGF